jgi:DNA-binding XRE family transcriptional regulator
VGEGTRLDANRGASHCDANRSSADKDDQNNIVATFGANLKSARLKLGLTQVQLADAAGLLQQYVSLVESGKQNVTLTTAETLAKGVDRDVRTLLARPRPRPLKD